jgi:hypothetical protein
MYHTRQQDSLASGAAVLTSNTSAPLLTKPKGLQTQLVPMLILLLLLLT